VTLNITLPPQLRDRIDALAKKQGVTRSALIEHCLLKILKECQEKLEDAASVSRQDVVRDPDLH
jgi:metal-responsive CopG/Arc/MetJ family transcriptional regulator